MILERTSFSLNYYLEYCIFDKFDWIHFPKKKFEENAFVSFPRKENFTWKMIASHIFYCKNKQIPLQLNFN